MQKKHLFTKYMVDDIDPNEIFENDTIMLEYAMGKLYGTALYVGGNLKFCLNKEERKKAPKEFLTLIDSTPLADFPNAKKMMLAMCDTKIKIGDVITNAYTGETLTLDDDNFSKIKGVQEYFKKLGIVSPYAKWVKENMEFADDEVKVKAQDFSKKSKHLILGDPVKVKDTNLSDHFLQGNLKEIKYKDKDAWDWEDTFVITNVRKWLGIDGGKHLFENLPDITALRKQVSYAEKIYKLYEIKCSNCGSFH